jgi:RNA polymerase sigma factor (TIGR02999 family)
MTTSNKPVGEDAEAVTRLLQRWTAGEDAALDRLMPLVYASLKSLAAGYLRREKAGHTLQPTAVVNEAFLRLVGQQRVPWESRTQFLAIAAKMMRRVLTDHARRKRADKRGGDAVRLELDEELDLPPEQPDRVALDDALAALEALDRRQAEVVELRFFAGLTIAETAAALDLSPATVKREWQTAKAWLYREMRRGERR